MESSVMDGSARTPKTNTKVKKKPYHIRKADLHLDEYRKEQQDRSPALLFKRAINSLRFSRQFHLYVAIQSVAIFVGYGQVMLVIGLFWAMVVNTGRRREGEMSAYSLFNEGVEA
jgi:hypothetical protein